MVDGKTLAAFLDISYRALYKLMAEGALPEPVAHIGNIKRWSTEKLMAWVLIGCPRIEDWKRKRIQAIRDYRALATPQGWNLSPKPTSHLTARCSTEMWTARVRLISPTLQR